MTNLATVGGGARVVRGAGVDTAVLACYRGRDVADSSVLVTLILGKSKRKQT